MTDKSTNNYSELKHPILILVEGPSDKFFFECFCEKQNFENIDFICVEGKPNFSKQIKALKLSSNFDAVVKSLGIIRDSDDNQVGSFQSIGDALRSAGMPVPSAPMEIAGEEIRVCSLLLPGNGRPGELEDLIIESWKDDPVSECVDEYFKCVERKKRYLPRKLSKAKVQVYLGSQKEIDDRIGIAAKKGYIDFDHPAFNIIRDFLSRITQE